jgi:hypothetical protein
MGVYVRVKATQSSPAHCVHRCPIHNIRKASKKGWKVVAWGYGNDMSNFAFEKKIRERIIVTESTLRHAFADHRGRSGNTIGQHLEPLQHASNRTHLPRIAR